MAVMELSHPMRVITSALDGDVLEVLARGEVLFTGREIARMVSASQQGVRNTLFRLVEQGIVCQERAGAAQLYRLNREHLAAGCVIALVGIREDLLARLRTLFAGWSQPSAYAALFGSAARGEDRADSDLDLFVLRPAGLTDEDPEWVAQIEHLMDRASVWTGNDARVLQIGLDDLAVVDEPDGVLEDVLRDGIPLAGERAVLRGALHSLRFGA
ncbi:MAG: hypothetical protein QG608_3243 [Actinomycetota bacterium]|nr:hypothetical protein [Actinomycetota bacterium]